MSYTLRIIDDMTISGQALADVISSLPQWRQDIVMRYKFEGGRRESALAFRLLLDMLRDEGLMEAEEIACLEFCIGEHGKPSIAGNSDIMFNLSHCKNAVACAISSEPIGIDVECIGRYNKGVAEYTLSEAELHTLYYDDNGIPRDDEGIQLQFTIFWTCKEAVLKLIGTGITDNVKTILHAHQHDVHLETVVNKQKKYVYTIAQYV